MNLMMTIKKEKERQMLAVRKEKEIVFIFFDVVFKSTVHGFFKP